jgi:DNA-directed RNA polymerase specialized sigma24 family protein
VLHVLGAAGTRATAQRAIALTAETRHVRWVASGSFPATRVSLVARLASDAPADRERALERVIRAYWKPVYKYVRLKWNQSHDDEGDTTQGFFAAATEKEYLAAFDPQKGRFRTFLRVCVDRFVSNARSADRSLKRGGAVERVELDFDLAESELGASGGIEDVERWFEREWARSIFSEATEELRRRSRDEPLGAVRMAVFERYDLVDAAERPSYADLAGALSIKVTDVTNHLAAARRELRAAVLDTLRELTASDDEFRSEARALLGVNAP